MLTHQTCFFVLLLISKLNAEDSSRPYNFRSTFRTPKDTPKRNYDDFEILERSNFHPESSEAPPPPPAAPKATASAQIHVKIADKRAVKVGDEPSKPNNEVDDTLKKLLIMLIKPLVENNNGERRVNPFFPFPPSPHPSPPHAGLLGGLSALSALSGGSNSPEAMKKAAKIVHKLKEQLKAESVENEIEDLKKDEDIPLKITLNNKPMRLQVDDGDENASVAERSEKLVDLAKLYPLLLQNDDEEEEKPKRKKKKPKVKAVDPLEVYLRRVFTPQTANYPLYGVLNYNNNLNGYLGQKIPLLTPKVLPQPQPQYLATEFVVHVPVLIKNKPPPPTPPPTSYNTLVNYPLLASLLTNYAI